MKKWLHRIVKKRLRLGCVLALSVAAVAAVVLRERPAPALEVLGLERKITPVGENYVSVAVRLKNNTGGMISFYAQDRGHPTIEASDVWTGQAVSGWHCRRGMKLYHLSEGEMLETTASLFAEDASCQLEFTYVESRAWLDAVKIIAGILPRNAREWLLEQANDLEWKTVRSSVIYEKAGLKT